jgi:hypothetical protein
MIWSRLSVLRALFASRAQARDAGLRWHRALRHVPELQGDLIRLGGILTLQPVENGEAQPLDPHRLAYEAGKRDLALQLLALMGLSITELNTLMEDDDA